MMNKYKILLLMFWVFGNLGAQTYQWIDLTGRITTDQGMPMFTDVQFIGEEGWITSSWTFEVYHTTDGGQTWDNQPVDGGSYSISMRDTELGYVSCANHLMRTTDGGEHWNRIEGHMSNTIFTVSFPPAPADTGFCGDGWGFLGKIVDDEIVEISEKLAAEFFSICFPVSDAKGYASGGHTIFKYTDYAWQLDEVYPNDVGGFNAIHFVDNELGWMVGEFAWIMHTSDGDTWVEQLPPDVVEGELQDVFFLNETEGWAVGDNGVVIHTIEGGENWLLEANGLTEQDLYAVCFTSPTNGYAVGDSNTVLKFCDLSSVENTPTTKPESFHLLQNYPNPFNPSTKIEYNVKEPCRVNLSVYNTNGQMIKKLVNSYQEPGKYSINLDMRDVSSGIYFYRIQMRNYHAVKKMVKIE